METINTVPTIEQILQPPSVKKGDTWQQDFEQRIQACCWLHRLSLQLQLPQRILTLAQVLFHRFYYLTSRQEVPMHQMLVVCLWTACRLEEYGRKPIDFFLAYTGNKGDLVMFRAKMRELEIQLLSKLQFKFPFQSAHLFLHVYTKQMPLDSELIERELLPLALAYLNDLYKLSASIWFQPSTLACTCLLMALKELKIAHDTKDIHWWAYLEVDIEEMELLAGLFQKHFLSKMKIFHLPFPDYFKIK